MECYKTAENNGKRAVEGDIIARALMYQQRYNNHINIIAEKVDDTSIKSDKIISYPSQRQQKHALMNKSEYLKR